MTSFKTARVGVGLAGFSLAILFLALAPAARAASTKIVPCAPLQQSLLTMPEIKSSGGRLQATLELVDGMRTLWDYPNTNRCATQPLRYLRGYPGFDPATAPAWPAGQEPLPGPTFRARVGDLVEIAFFNDIDTQNFQGALDKGAVGSMAACDQYTSQGGPAGSTGSGSAGPGDTMPNCLHGSSTTNVHFHGTHTTPSTTGDNVLLFVRPSLRVDGQRQPNRSQANLALADVFERCEHHGPPQLWTDMPESWQALQKDIIQQYDRTAPYQGVNGALPATSQLWPTNESEIANGQWPQYQIGAYPYCFPLPKWDPAATSPRMGQAPGTHWYHAHKHGSTALNVANGLTGTLIVEGQYDDDLRKYYGAKLKEQVLMIQQLGTAPFPVTNPTVNQGGPGAARPAISVNGRLNPVVTMAPGEVQLWRIVNGAFRDAVQLYYFEPQSATSCAAATPPASFPISWRQIAQDGVQFALANYNFIGSVNFPVNLAPANRADVLVKAPAETGKYTLCVVRNVGLPVQGTVGAPDKPSVLLTVNVTGTPIDPPMEFIPDAEFPALPRFLDDIPPSEIKLQRTIVFGADHKSIDGKSFQDRHIDQTMQLNTAEEWTVMNQANDKAHPFHIHINPFQLTGIFQPNGPEATTPPTPEKPNPCYVNPNDPSTFKACPALQPPAPFAWWDTFPIPTARKVPRPECKKIEDCPANLQPYITCSRGTCNEIIPGWFKMRTRFVDFTGQYVTHCHILIHEDRGMMQLIQVVPDTTPYGHH